MPYLPIVAVLAGLAIVFWVAFYIYFKRHPNKFAGLNVALAILIVGPFLPLIQASLAKRNYGITNREILGLIAVACLLIVAVTISVIFGVGVRPQ